MSHVSPKLKQGWFPCEIAAMNDCESSDDMEFCPAYKDPDDCPKYRRFMILEGETQRAGWEFNLFEVPDFAGFWERLEQDWAEQFKIHHYYGEEEDPDFATCPECGLVGSCMCDLLAEEAADPEGLGLDYGGDYY